MKKIILTIMLAFAALTMTGCSYDTVPQGHIGKILDRSGFHPEVYPPSRVDVGLHGSLVLVDSTTHTVNETVTVRMADDMNLVVQVRFKLRMGDKEISRNKVFNEIIPAAGRTITLEQIYAVHGKMLVNKIVREVLNPYNIGDVNNDFNNISAAIYAKTLIAFKPTPLIVADVALGKLDYPQVIDDAIEAAAKRTLEIDKEKADVQVKLIALQGQEKLAKGKYRIKMQEAKRIRDYNKMIGQGITPELLELRRLEVQEMMASKIDKGDTVFVPYGSLNQVGLSNRIYSK